MTVPATVRRRYPATVALLTVMWVLGICALVLWLVGLGMQGWAEQYSADSAALERRTTTVLLVLAAVVAGGPLVIAGTAFTGGSTRTGVVFLVLAAVLAVPALAVAAGAYRSLNPPAPPPPGPAVCQEHSGGDTRCPGG
jgi:hypothetical protein